jgi:SsrA-binding protein
MRQRGIKIIAKNRRARHDYELLEKFEAGLALTGSEIKSVRGNRVNLQRGFVQSRSGELWLLDVHIAPYEFAGHEKHDPDRPRKLLLHRREINKINEAISTKGLTMIPTKMYLKDGWAKVEIALARGKRKYDKRSELAKRDAKRQVERALREKFR